MQKGSSKLVGKTVSSKYYGDFVVKESLGSGRFVVVFINTGYETTAQQSKITRGEVKDHLAPCVFGVGITSNLSTKEANGKTSLDYNIWCGILERCYSDKYHKLKPTYKGCTVSDFFIYYSNFKAWCEKQIGFGNKGWHLDKDILIKGNKVYSEDTCCFVPQEINSVITNCRKRRGELPIGVTLEKDTGLYKSIVSYYGKNKTIGRYKTPEEAFYAYKQAKEGYIKEVTNKWRDEIDPRTYDSLMNWKIEIVD